MNRLMILNLIALGICFLGAAKGKTTVVAPSIQPVYSKLGDPLELTCEQSDGDEVEWLKDGDVIDTGSSPFVTTNNQKDGKITSKLFKQTTETGDAGSYTCKPTTGSSDQAYNVEVFVFEVSGEPGSTNKSRTDSVSLSCVVASIDDYTLEWARAGEALKVDGGDKYEVESDLENHNHTLTVMKVVEGDEGLYECVVKLSNGAEFTTEVALNMGAQVHNFVKSRNIIQGDPLQMDCKAYGWPLPDIKWFKEGEPLDMADERIKLTNYTSDHEQTLENATVRIENLDFEDRAEYSCEAKNDISTNDAMIQVRVKDKLAALWPFLGICAEVAILCAIIFIYERRRAKKMEEEERKEEADHLTNSHAHRGNDDIRQRK